MTRPIEFSGQAMPTPPAAPVERQADTAPRIVASMPGALARDHERHGDAEASATSAKTIRARTSLLPFRIVVSFDTRRHKHIGGRTTRLGSSTDRRLLALSSGNSHAWAWATLPSGLTGWQPTLGVDAAAIRYSRRRDDQRRSSRRATRSCEGRPRAGDHLADVRRDERRRRCIIIATAISAVLRREWRGKASGRPSAPSLQTP